MSSVSGSQSSPELDAAAGPELDASARRFGVVLSNNLKRRVLFSDSRFSRLVRRPLWKLAYDMVCRDVLAKDYTKFLNLGYLANPGELDAEDGADIADRVSERLYDQIVGDADLTGRTVVEVGCGPGAGSAHLARTNNPASLIGVDLNKHMIAWCREHHDATNLRFQQGDAQNLPIASDSVDAVVNIESSHCYPSRSRFFEEVMRILHAGGSFFFADLIYASSEEGPDAVSDRLRKAGLVIEDRIDITENVLAARDAVSRSRHFRSHVRENVPARMVPIVEESFLLTGTRSYARLAAREVQYFQWRAVKPDENPPEGGSVIAS
jgi:SAM-dependent methyltransferase